MEGTLAENGTGLGLCPCSGETVTVNGHPNDLWVSTGKRIGQYSFRGSAVYLQDGSHGGLTVENGYCWEP